MSELELVNDLLRSRISELESAQEAARKSEAVVRESEIILRVQVNKLESKNTSFMKRIRLLRKVLLSSTHHDDGSIKQTSSDNTEKLSIPRDALVSLLEYADEDEDRSCLETNADDNYKDAHHASNGACANSKLPSISHHDKRVLSGSEPSSKRFKIKT